MVVERVSVVVVNWNGRHLLEACLSSLESQTHRQTEVIVVDNGSTDDSIEWTRANHPRVRIVSMGQNRGFAAGCNAGIGVASGTLIALLNTDAVADARWLEVLVAAIRGRPDVGMVASKMVLLRTPSIIDSTGICLDATGVAWDRRVGESAAPVESRSEIFGPCGGAALYRRELFRDIGGFDEDFFMYLEDVDLAWRARLAGWRCMYDPDALVGHLHSASAGENSPFQLFHLARNRVWTIVKNYQSPHFFRYLPAIILFDVLSTGAAIVRPRPGAASLAARLAAARGKLAALRQVPVYLRKRRQVQRRERVPAWRVACELRPIVWLTDPIGFRDVRQRARPQATRQSGQAVNGQ